jgi:DNA-binding PadR family transcriptional regulator
MSDTTQKPELPLNPRDFLILMALAENPLHGYGLLKEVEILSEGQVRFDPANLYRTLKKMIKQDLVSELESAPENVDAPKRRKYYQVTETGSRVIGAEASRLARLAELAKARHLVNDGELVR